MERYQAARAVQAEIDAERARRKEEAERGAYMETGPARDAWSKELSDLLQAIEAWFPDLAQLLAAEIAAGGTLDAKTITVRLRAAWRAFRAKRADLAASACDAEPELVEPVQED